MLCYYWYLSYELWKWIEKDEKYIVMNMEERRVQYEITEPKNIVAENVIKKLISLRGYKK